MTMDPQAWNKRQLKRAINIIDQVAGKKVDGLDLSLTRHVANIRDRINGIDSKMAEDRRAKIQHEREASDASTPKFPSSGAAGMPAVKPAAKRERYEGSCERCPYPDTCNHAQRCTFKSGSGQGKMTAT